jgi:hypothetical protein
VKHEDAPLHGNSSTIIRLTMIFVFATGLLVGFLTNHSHEIRENIVIKTTTYPVLIDSVEEVCFTGIESCEEVLSNIIRQANKSIYMAAHSLAVGRLTKALTEAAGRGVSIMVVVKEGNTYTAYPTYGTLREKGVRVLVHNTNADMHHNFMVIDREVVVLSSYGWPPATNSSMIVIRSWRVAGEFLIEFSRLLGTTGIE